MRLENLECGPLTIDSWELHPDERWCVLGGNASGKTLLGQIIAGDVEPRKGRIVNAPNRPALLSFESLQAAYEEELKNDDTDFLDRIDYGTTGLELLLESGCEVEEARSAALEHGIAHLLDRGCRQFSTGELRKTYLLQAALTKSDLLILDEPYEGLDSANRSDLDGMLAQLIAQRRPLLLLANRLADVQELCTHLALLHKGKIVLMGPRESVLANPSVAQLFSIQSTPPRIPDAPRAIETRFDPVLRLSNVRIHYGDTVQFDSFSWTLRPGQHTLITGPNGCGKSSLLALLTGDHPQCYSNDITLFGYRRGSGESIWDIKRHIGYVSAAFHRDYRVNCAVETAVVSGFHDSIGLYEPSDASERDIARQWLALFSLESLSAKPFRSLSYGQQRLVLVARALVKGPPLLILDEPTQGLDELNRHLVLSCLERLAALPRTTMLFVSHREDERLKLFRHCLHFEASPDPGTRFRIAKAIVD